MSPAWMLQAMAAGALLGLGALAAERVAGWFGVPRRTVWVAAMLGSLVLAALSLWAPGLLPDPGIFPAAAAPAPVLDVGTPPPFSGGPPSPGAARSADAAPSWTGPAGLLGPGWLAASLAMLGAVGWTYRRLRRAGACGVRVELDGGEVRVTERVGPAVVGLVHPAVVVPRWVLDAPAGERRLILLHEREHVAAGDAWLLFLGTLAVAAMPWSLPLWWQHRRLRAAVEADCDARVLARGASRREYGRVLIRTAGCSPGLPHFGPAWGDSTSHLERRIMVMTAKRPSHPLLRSVPLLALAAAVVLTACDVAAGAEAEASLTASPASASLRVGVAAGLGAAGTSRATDTLPPLPPLAPLAPAAPAPPPDAPAPLPPPPPDAPAPPSLLAPPAPEAHPAPEARPAPAAPPSLLTPAARSVPGAPPSLLAPGARPTPAARPATAASRAAPSAGRPGEARRRATDTTRIITDTMAASPDPSRPMPKASTGFEHAFPIKLVGRSREEMRVLDYYTVARVRPGTGAARAGIRAGDVILALNGMDAREFRNWVGLVTQEPGTGYALRIRRGATVRDIAAVLDRPTEGKPLW